ncbi:MULTISPECIES: HPr kinase/phosphorylase [Nitrospirillum]|uniref:HPr serine kinase-like protein n=1 Tax=Nitrospirillum amazonense TaxID=28077 RepID=A0A560FFX3_9PROT|nr:HPr kinase/phosphatase C-terminal domain-containing protein [Nitrospirillum amazonense]MEC4595049.1 HPr kinase/phosphatase C-terminal domain-containing protein [Nitrospirillum amazonense]TWB20515.1 HPr serine kinase-like protein [Nitrospirillum amazonense]
MIRVHATCVSVGGAGVLLRGPSGSGKSDLALRLVDAGALLVADDQVDLVADPTGTLLTATAPECLAGLIEVRGLGILPAPATPSAFVRLVVDLVDRDAVSRLPDPAAVTLAGVAVPRVALWPFAASAPAALRLALAAVAAGLPLVPAAFEEVAA